MKKQILSDLKDARYNLKHLAEKMGCNYEHLSRVLSGYRPMSYKTAVKLRDALNDLTSKKYKIYFTVDSKILVDKKTTK